MDVKAVTPILNVSSVVDSVAWFVKLGFRHGFLWGDPPTFGSVCSGQSEIFLCLGEQGGRGDQGVWMSLWVEDVDAIHQRCVSLGFDVTMPPTDEPWGVREMHLRHPDGHVFRISKGNGEE